MFLDNLVVDQRSNCSPGAQVLDPTDPQTSAGQPKFKSAPSAKGAVTSKKKKKKKKKKPKVSIPFASSEPNSSFFCRLAPLGGIEERAFRPCASPFKSKVKKGKRYQFEVVAVDGAGNPDPDPVSITFKAKGKKKK